MGLSVFVARRLSALTRPSARPPHPALASAATAALEARKRVEEDARVLDRIDASLRAIAKKDDFPPR